MRDGAPPQERAFVTRRSVVRATAGAAWSAPLVTVLAAAPAQAVGSQVVLGITGTFTHPAGNRNVTFTSGNVTNNGTETTTNLQVTVTIVSNGTNTLSGTTVATTPSGFTASAVTAGGSSGAFTASVTFTASSQLAGGGNVAFAPVLRVPNTAAKSTAGSGTATATATSAASASTNNGYAG